MNTNKLIYHMDRVIGKKRPITAELFLTNFCNNRCKYCRFHHGKGYISFEDFVIWSNRLLDFGVEGFILSGGGEPTINPDFGKITSWLQEKKIPFGVNSNFNVLKYFKPVYLKISIDGATAEEYQQKRLVSPSKFDELIENMKVYRKWQKVESPNTTLGIQSLETEVGHATKFWNTFKDLDVDYIVFRPLESVDPYYSSEQALNIQEEIKALSQLDPRVISNYKWNYLSKQFKGCFADWSVITVNWDGTVQHCCHKPNEIIGHIMDNDILEKKLKHHTDMKTCEVPCRLTGANLFMESLNFTDEHNFFV